MVVKFRKAVLPATSQVHTWYNKSLQTSTDLHLKALCTHLLKELCQAEQDLPFVAVTLRNAVSKVYHLFTKILTEVQSLKYGVCIACIPEVLQTKEARILVYTMEFLCQPAPCLSHLSGDVFEEQL